MVIGGVCFSSFSFVPQSNGLVRGWACMVIDVGSWVWLADEEVDTVLVFNTLIFTNLGMCSSSTSDRIFSSIEKPTDDPRSENVPGGENPCCQAHLRNSGVPIFGQTIEGCKSI